MADIVALPAPEDESGLKAALMRSARFACDDERPVAAYFVCALYEDGRTAVGGMTEFGGDTPMNARLFAAMVAEESRTLFCTAPEVERHIFDEEC